MQLTSLVLKNFRNHKHLEMEFNSRVNFIVGDNGIGKTNILEAIHLMSTGRSFRTAQLTDLICHEQPSFYLEAQFLKEGISQTLKIGYDGKKKHITYNASPLPAFSHLLGIIPSVIYSPKDIALIIGAPVERRRFLNLYLGQSDPLYIHHLVRYTKALEHRNALLKTKKEQHIAELECFEQEMATSSLYLMNARKEALKTLENTISPLLSRLTQKHEVFSMYYQPSFAMHQELCKDYLIAQYKEHRKKELFVGTSLIGPHRDDFSIYLDGHLVKTFCSEGQKRSFLSALKIAEWELLKAKIQKPPLMCIDDLGIHLDKEREVLLEQHIHNLGQVFITSPKHPLWQNLSDGVKIFKLN